jgi:hypothetical protein
VSASQQVQAHMHKHIHTFAVVKNKKDRQNTKQEHLYKHKEGYKRFYHQKIHPGGTIKR